MKEKKQELSKGEKTLKDLTEKLREARTALHAAANLDISTGLRADLEREITNIVRIEFMLS